jgi:hypothetical protein
LSNEHGDVVVQVIPVLPQLLGQLLKCEAKQGARTSRREVEDRAGFLVVGFRLVRHFGVRRRTTLAAARETEIAAVPEGVAAAVSTRTYVSLSRSELLASGDR